MQIKLVVVDSVTFHFRQNFSNMGQRTRVLGEMGQKLMQLAAERDVAVSTSLLGFCAAASR